MPRSLDLLDLPTLYRYRDGVISFDSARLLTRGNPLGAMGMMAYLNPVRHIYSAVSDGNGDTLLGGIIHSNGDTFSKLLYLAPSDQLGSPKLLTLIEHLAAEAGNWGTFHILAEVDERSDAYRALRMTGFSVYAWQRIWDLSELPEQKTAAEKWRHVKSEDVPAIQSLHYQIVPTLMHPFEQPPKRATGLTCCSSGMRGYVGMSSGPYGIVLTPLIHPEANGVAETLLALLNHIPDRRGRKVYLCVRSYQAWLEPVLEDLGAKSNERQAVMVKHLARMVKDEQLARTTQPATAIPASRISHTQVKHEK